ncbi:ragulator complex protein LAMTOR3-like isoform X3 [Amblyomma americanum]
MTMPTCCAVNCMRRAAKSSGKTFQNKGTLHRYGTTLADDRTSLHTELKKHLIQLISRVPGLQAIVFTDRDGVPLIKAATDSAPEHALRPGFLATVGMAMSQGNKLGLGKCNKMVSSYSNYQVVSFNRHPVTITLVASSSANTGMILNLEEELNTVSQTLRSVVEAS